MSVNARHRFFVAVRVRNSRRSFCFFLSPSISGNCVTEPSPEIEEGRVADCTVTENFESVGELLLRPGMNETEMIAGTSARYYDRARL